MSSNVSDTARWMAAYRAAETARPEALFDDPFADSLAGDSGHAIAGATARLVRSGWWWVIRTKLIDDPIAEAVKSGCDRVLNLATGFDTRPYRLDLPTELEWIEADLPEIVNEKQRLPAFFDSAFGTTATGTPVANIPVLLFCMAFGLSMDYEVFLIARIREYWDKSAKTRTDNDESVALGVARTGRVVTAAAMLMVMVIPFSALISTQVSFMRMFGEASDRDPTIVPAVINYSHPSELKGGQMSVTY